ncbi:MAG: 3TM-type holin, partial [Bdellovibrionales bacterium]
ARGQITPEQMERANAHVEKMAELELSERKVALEQINESLRAEVSSQDSYVRRMRPTFGYLIAVTWAAQMLALAYVIVFETAKASLVIEAMESLGTIWAVGLSVLGIYVYKRSEEKKLTRANSGYMPLYSPMENTTTSSSIKERSSSFND